MSFTDGLPRVATEEDIWAHWGGGRPGERFRCYLCGHRFAVGDVWRFQPMQGAMNFIVCGGCDGDDVVERWKAWKDELERRAWWFVPREHRCMDFVG